ncbi:MAG: hypothetical protein UC337_02785, partial [Slackia sp.]|nr:hypothetical protein [Slackia sp.]
FNGAWLPNVAGVLRDGKNLDHETKEIILHTIRNFGSVASASVRERFGSFIERMRAAAGLGDNQS